MIIQQCMHIYFENHLRRSWIRRTRTFFTHLGKSKFLSHKSISSCFWVLSADCQPKIRKTSISHPKSLPLDRPRLTATLPLSPSAPACGRLVTAGELEDALGPQTWVLRRRTAGTCRDRSAWKGSPGVGPFFVENLRVPPS